MKALSNKKVLSVSLVLLGLVWCLVMYVVASWYLPPHSSWGGIAGGIMAVVIAVAYVLGFRVTPGAQAVEVGGISIIATIVFLVISVAMNTLLIVINCGNFNGGLLAGNVIVDVSFLVLTFYMDRHAMRVASQLERTGKRSSASDSLSRTLGSLIGMAEDAEVSGRLVRLKEAVDHSSNISTARTISIEQQFAAELTELGHMMAASADSAAVLEKIQKAERIWKRRCAAALSRQ